MITNWIFYILIFFLGLIRLLFSLLNFVIPDQITEGLTWLFSLFKYGAGIINMPEILLASVVLLNFFALFYTVKFIQWIYYHLPWVGKHKPLPTLKK